jgi:hypothetical protein
MLVENGALTSFGGDSWCSISPLKDMFPDLYCICNEQLVIVIVAAAMGWMFKSKRWLTPDLILQRDGLLSLLNQINLNQARDVPFWKWAKGGKFTVESVYKHLCSNGIDRSFRHL